MRRLHLAAVLNAALRRLALLSVVVCAALPRADAAMTDFASASDVWAVERVDALVRLTVYDGESRSSVDRTGTGFIVNSTRDQQYILTSTHVVAGRKLDASPGCDPLPPNLVIEGYAGELRGSCVHHLGRDISAIRLSTFRRQTLPSLPLRGCRLDPGTRIYLAGYPLGGDVDAQRNGVVTGRGLEWDLLVTDIPTTGGMSGGPYLSADGDVVGIHQGGVRFVAGFAHLMPMQVVDAALRNQLDIEVDFDDGACPTPPTLESALTAMARHIGIDLFQEQAAGDATRSIRARLAELEQLNDRIEALRSELAKVEDRLVTASNIGPRQFLTLGNGEVPLGVEEDEGTCFLTGLRLLGEEGMMAV